MKRQSTALGIALMSLTAFVFAVQDGVSRLLAESYPAAMVIMVRYWFFAAFVSLLAVRHAGGVAVAVRTRRPWLQIARGVLLVTEIFLMLMAFTRLGLTETHAVFSVYPLLVAALAGPVLGERVGWRRWTAIAIGFCGVVVILEPGAGVFRIDALIPFAAATLFALYGLLTRAVARDDPAAVSFFWVGVVGAGVATIFGLPFWQPIAAADWGWFAVLCLIAALSHWLLIRAYAVAEASAIQPFAYLQLPFAAAIGITAFGETLRTNVVLGAALVVGAGLFTLWRARQLSSANPPEG